MVVRKKKIKSNQGQSLFEFIIFLPFFVGMFLVLTSIFGAINSSINQQKAVRGYFHYLIKGNSTLPLKTTLDQFGTSYNNVGVYSIGWRDQTSGETPVAPCFKMSPIFMGPSRPSETCLEPQDDIPNVAFLIRAFTMYGICGEVYQSPGGIVNRVSHQDLSGGSLFGSCSIRLQ